MVRIATFGFDWRRACAWVGLVLALAWVASCATRPLETPETREITPIGAIALFDENESPAKIRLNLPPHEHLRIIAFSGGGVDGAFGAGLLVGWTESGTRPQFDIVTGISTGALLSVFAFLGPDYDREIERLYTSVSDRDIYRSKGIAGLFGASLLDNSPLKRQIERVVTLAMLDRIAAEHRRGRRLYIGTTNLDAGALVVWDMGAIAASGHPARLRVFQKVLRASAAVPGLFKPVYFQPNEITRARQMHVDGGVKAPVLIRSFMFKIPAKRRTLYVVINGQLRLDEASAAVKPALLDISRKSISELLRGLLYKTLYQGYVTARNARAGFKVTAIPDSVPTARDALHFDHNRMVRLFELGRKFGREGNAWRNEPPRLEDFERVAAPATRRARTRRGTTRRPRVSAR